MNPLFQALFTVTDYDEIELRSSNSTRKTDLLPYHSFDDMALMSPPAKQITIEWRGTYSYERVVKGEKGKGVMLGQVVRAWKEAITAAARVRGGKHASVICNGLMSLEEFERCEYCGSWPADCNCTY
jgi:hypothetical protein